MTWERPSPDDAWMNSPAVVERAALDQAEQAAAARLAAALGADEHALPKDEVIDGVIGMMRGNGVFVRRVLGE